MRMGQAPTATGQAGPWPGVEHVTHLLPHWLRASVCAGLYCCTPEGYVDLSTGFGCGLLFTAHAGTLSTLATMSCATEAVWPWQLHRRLSAGPLRCGVRRGGHADPVQVGCSLPCVSMWADVGLTPMRDCAATAATWWAACLRVSGLLSGPPWCVLSCRATTSVARSLPTSSSCPPLRCWTLATTREQPAAAAAADNAVQAARAA